MKFSDLREEVVDCIESGISVELISQPGLGKSSWVDGLVSYLSERDGEEWGFADLFLATQTPPDLIGYQFKGEVEYDGKRYSITDPTMPSWFMTKAGKPVFAHKRGILFLDEYGQGETDVKRASAELLLNKRLGPWRLPDGWGVIAASNRTTDRSGVTKSLDFVINRRGEYHITPDLDDWTTWAQANGVMQLTIAFANQHSEIVFSAGVPEEQGPWCTPRSLVMFDKLLRKRAERGAIPDKGPIVETANGLIGAAAARAYFVFVRLEREMPKYEAILKDPKGVKVPDRPDAAMLICFNLAHRLKKEDAEPVVEYVKRLPKEFAVTFAKATVQRDWSMITTPAFAKWTKENASLMTMISGLGNNKKK